MATETGDGMSTAQAPLKQRLRDHVTSRLPGSEPIIKNGAWQMMLDAADEIDRLEKAIAACSGVTDVTAGFE